MVTFVIMGVVICILVGKIVYLQQEKSQLKTDIKIISDLLREDN